METKNLEEALKEFSDWGVSHYASITVATYTDFLRRYIKFSGNKDISQTDITDVNEYYLDLKKKDYHDGSIALMMISIRQFFRFLFLRKMITWNYELIGVPKFISRSHTPIETPEARKMIDKIKETNFYDLRDKTMISFLYSSGVRVSECCKMRLEDLKEDHAIIISAKNFKQRMIFWDDDTGKLLKKYLADRISKTDYLFIARHGGKFTTRGVQRIVKKYRTNKNITPHSFRHGLGARLVKNGTHPRYIMEILGHKNISSSQVYMQVNNAEIIQAYKNLNCKKAVIVA